MLPTEYERQGLVDALELLGGEESCGFGAAGEIDGGELVAHDQGPLARDVDGWPEAGLGSW